MDKNELMYFATNLHSDYRVLFSALVWYTSETLYALNCFHSSNLFGCSGMKSNHYCILNKQYDKESYALMAKRIVAHMRETGEWGRYFPSSISPFPYNCSVAHEYYPLSKEEILRRGLTWLDPDEIYEKKPQGNVTEPVSHGARVCDVSGKPFNVTKQECELYANLSVPMPTKCPTLRRNERMRQIKTAIRWYDQSLAL